MIIEKPAEIKEETKILAELLKRYNSQTVQQIIAEGVVAIQLALTERK